MKIRRDYSSLVLIWNPCLVLLIRRITLLPLYPLIIEGSAQREKCTCIIHFQISAFENIHAFLSLNVFIVARSSRTKRSHFSRSCLFLSKTLVESGPCLYSRILFPPSRFRQWNYLLFLFTFHSPSSSMTRISERKDFPYVSEFPLLFYSTLLSAENYPFYRMAIFQIFMFLFFFSKKAC